MRRAGGTTRLVVVVAALVAGILGSAVPSVQAATSEPATTEPVTLRQVGHGDNPLRQGTSHLFINSDLAFSGDFAIAGNHDGFSVWDISQPEQPALVSAVSCAGSQGDVSVVGNLVVLSVDDTMSSDRCDAGRVSETQQNWEGIRIFDISNPAQPVYVKSVQTRCGSHTNTVVPTAEENVVLVYVNAYSRGPSRNCVGVNPLQIVRLELGDPQAAAEVAAVDLFAGRDTFTEDDWIPGGAQTRDTTGCHDITVFENRALAACRGDGLLLDITDPLAPIVLDQVRDPEMSFWHSAIFNNDGTIAVFQDEMGDGMINACTEATGPTRGADSFWRINGNRLEHVGYFKIPRFPDAGERCAAHNGSVIPVPGKDLLVQAWYDAGVSVLDFTNAATATEIAFVDPEPYANPPEYLSGYWSAYYYNGYVYATNTWEGLDVFALDGAEFADAARYVSTSLNPQTQPKYAWVWNEAPLLPEDRSDLPMMTVSLDEKFAVSPELLAREPSFPVTLSAPDGTFSPDTRIDIWLKNSPGSVANAQTTAAGGLEPLTVDVPNSTRAVTYALIARGDASRDALAWAEIRISPDWLGNLFIYSGAFLGIPLLLLGMFALLWWRRELVISWLRKLRTRLSSLMSRLRKLRTRLSKLKFWR